MWQVFQWPSGDQMRHLKAFILSVGKRYQDLIPYTDRIEPNRSAGPKGITGWAYGAATDEQDLMLLYFEKDCPRAVVSGMKPNAKYNASWFDPRDGSWIGGDAPLVADGSGKIQMPPYPEKTSRSQKDWAFKITLIQER
jgi:hypothetical protein